MKNCVRFCLAALVLSSTACEKQESEEVCQNSCTTVTGRLVTANGQQPIPGANVVAKWMNIYGLSVSAKGKAYCKTDDDGNYTLSFYVNDNELLDGYFQIFYSVDNNRYYTIGEPSVGLYDVKRDTAFHLDNFVIPRKAYVNLIITNQDQLIADRGQFTSSFNSCYGFNSVFNRNIQGGGAGISWNGLPTANPMPISGDQPILVRSYKTKNGVQTFSTDSLFIPAGTTQNYTVTY